MCFTGGYIEELRQNKINEKLLNNVDLLIDGPFMFDRIDYSRPWCGSSNQRYHFLTDIYNEKIFVKYTNKVEVNISKDGFEDLVKNISTTVPLSMTQREQILALRNWANVRAVSATKLSNLKQYTKEINNENITSSRGGRKLDF